MQPPHPATTHETGHGQQSRAHGQSSGVQWGPLSAPEKGQKISLTPITRGPTRPWGKVGAGVWPPVALRCVSPVVWRVAWRVRVVRVVRGGSGCRGARRAVPCPALPVALCPRPVTVDPSRPVTVRPSRTVRTVTRIVRSRPHGGRVRVRYGARVVYAPPPFRAPPMVDCRTVYLCTMVHKDSLRFFLFCPCVHRVTGRVYR